MGGAPSERSEPRTASAASLRCSPNRHVRRFLVCEGESYIGWTHVRCLKPPGRVRRIALNEVTVPALNE